MAEMMSDLQWMRARQWIKRESEGPKVHPVSDYHEGYLDGYRVAMLKVWGYYFQTEEERVEGERVRREMFG